MKRVSRYSGRYYENRYGSRYPRGRRFVEASSVKKLTPEDFVSQEEIDNAVQTVLSYILESYNDECEAGEDEDDFDPAAAFEDCVENNTNCDDFMGDELAYRLSNEMDLEEKLTFKNYKQWCKLYDIDLSEYEFIR